MAYQKPRRGLSKHRKNLVLTGLSLALLITVSGTALFLFSFKQSNTTPQAAQTTTKQKTAAPIATISAATPGAVIFSPTAAAEQVPLISFQLTPTAAAPITAIPVGGGWQQKFYQYAQSISFSPSNPSVGYICGAFSETLGQLTGPIYIGITQNGGASWLIYLTPIQDSGCAISVDPLQPNDVALVTDPCGLGCGISGADMFSLYRATDGGKTWNQQGISGNSKFGQVLAWSGSNLYVSQNSNIYFSAPGGAFHVVNMTAMLHGTPQIGTIIKAVYGTPSAIYVAFSNSNCSGGENCGTLAVSQNNGQSWTHTAYSTNISNIILTGIDPVSGALFAMKQPLNSNESTTIYQSTDNGKTWSALPALPQGITASAIILIAPGKALLMLCQSAQSTFLYEYNFSARKWIHIAAPAALAQLTNIQYSIQGAQLIVWAEYIDQSTVQLTSIALP